MRILTAIIILLAALWGGYWFVGARGTERALAAWFADRQAEGWLAEYDTLDTEGFPSRFDTMITSLDLADPDTGLAISLPFFQILTLSYTPNHVIVAFPHDFALMTPSEKIAIKSEQMRGSVVFVPGTSLAIDRTSFELSALDIESAAGSSQVAAGQFATRRQTELENGQEIFFEATGFRPASGFLTDLGAGDLPDTFQNLRLDAVAGFDAPWDRFALERRRPQPTSIEIKELKGAWGDMLIEAAGSLKIDATGQPTGEIDVRARGWQQMVTLAKNTGALPPDIAGAVEGALQFIAGLSGNPDTLDAKLSFRGGLTLLAGIPVGRAPVVAIR